MLMTIKYILPLVSSINNDVELSSATCLVESCLSDITNWMSSNKLKLNTGKTELLVLHSKFRQMSLQPSMHNS